MTERMRQTEPESGPGLTKLGALLTIVLVGGFLYFGYHLVTRKTASNPQGGTVPPTATSAARADVEPGGAPTPTGVEAEIGIAYGTEKKAWLQWAVEEFRKTDAGRNIKINLIPKGSLEGAHAILAGDAPAKQIDVWSPASSLYKDVFVSEWQVRQGTGNPIAREEALALTPMVFVMWDERYGAFVGKYKEVSFETIAQALGEPGGWDAIADKPEWGLFKFGHTHPNESNSGLMTLVLMAYEKAGKIKGLELKDIVDVKFQNWMGGIERGVSGLSPSTGTMMREMILKGPSSYDALFVYENVAIEHLKNAEGRWGKLRVIYPRINMWNDNPYYVLNAPWVTPQRRKAAEAFCDYLLSEPVQREALVQGFRPGNPAVHVKFPESPFMQYQDVGLKVDLTTVAEPPRAEVVNNLLASWQRTRGSR